MVSRRPPSDLVAPLPTLGRSDRSATAAAVAAAARCSVLTEYPPRLPPSKYFSLRRWAGWIGALFDGRRVSCGAPGLVGGCQVERRCSGERSDLGLSQEIASPPTPRPIVAGTAASLSVSSCYVRHRHRRLHRRHQRRHASKQWSDAGLILAGRNPPPRRCPAETLAQLCTCVAAEESVPRRDGTIRRGDAPPRSDGYLERRRHRSASRLFRRVSRGGSAEACHKWRRLYPRGEFRERFLSFSCLRSYFHLQPIIGCPAAVFDHLSPFVSGMMSDLCLRLFQGTFSLVIEAWHEKEDSDEAASFEGEFSSPHYTVF